MIPKRKKKIDISTESMIELMQETYNEIVDERNKALAAYKRFSRDIQENDDIVMVGKITNDLLKIIDGSIEKKIRLIKIQGDILYKNGTAPKEGTNMALTEEDRQWAADFIKKGKDSRTKEYGDE